VRVDENSVLIDMSGWTVLFDVRAKVTDGMAMLFDVGEATDTGVNV
jgi:hypothetical protein